MKKDAVVSERTFAAIRELMDSITESSAQNEPPVGLVLVAVFSNHENVLFPIIRADVNVDVDGLQVDPVHALLDTAKECIEARMKS